MILGVEGHSQFCGFLIFFPDRFPVQTCFPSLSRLIRLPEKFVLLFLQGTLLDFFHPQVCLPNKTQIGGGSKSSRSILISSSCVTSSFLRSSPKWRVLQAELPALVRAVRNQICFRFFLSSRLRKSRGPVYLPVVDRWRPGRTCRKCYFTSFNVKFVHIFQFWC